MWYESLRYVNGWAKGSVIQMLIEIHVKMYQNLWNSLESHRNPEQYLHCFDAFRNSADAQRTFRYEESECLQFYLNSLPLKGA